MISLKKKMIKLFPVVDVEKMLLYNFLIIITKDKTSKLKFKNYTSLHHRREFPELKKQVKDHLWAPSNWHGSVGIGFEVVENSGARGV